MPRPLGGSLWRGLRVGLFGGSFNPAHAGHLHASLLALKHLDLDQIWWLVSPQNPLKSPAAMAPFEARLAGARTFARYPRLTVTALETRLGTRFTADTLTRLRAAFPQTRFVWIMGADNLIQISEWERWRAIFETMPIAVFDRPPYSLRAVNAKAAQRYEHAMVPGRRARRLASMRPPAWAFFHTLLMAISATDLRREGKIGESGS